MGTGNARLAAYEGGYRAGDVAPERRAMPTIDVDFSELKPNFIRPELLQHPNIPKSLAGVNPRTIMGKEWWDILRRATYEVNNYHCFACGVPAADAILNQWLEAHECYEYQWRKKILKYKEVVALCYSCHNFIHSGRLSHLYLDARIGREEARSILLHGLRLLHKAGLPPDRAAIYAAAIIRGEPLDFIGDHKIRPNPP
ncbi:unnamed protein product, partial [marine sediment metagenome]